MMKTAVIACEVMRYELEMLCAGMEKAPSLLFLRQGLHDTPKLLREELHNTIAKVEKDNPELTRLVLGYGLCGKGLEGVSAGRCELVIPRVHDCIPLLIGSVAAHREAHSRECGTYWFSPGWLTWSVIPYLDNRTVRLAHYTEKYGEAQAGILMQIEEGILANYTRACLIQWPVLGEPYREPAADAARRSNLPLDTMEGTPDYLRALLAGDWDDDRFVRIPPGHTVCQSMNADEVIRAGAPVKKKTP